ncbi:MAG: 12-oxophytodienoate reductase [Sphingomonadales bacterium]|nr:12-oxophytodienoate reductase [Sphingomonadales bacterium]
MPGDIEALFEPLRIGQVEVPTRIVMPGMQRGRSVDGHILPEMGDYYARRVRGGAGMIIGEGCCVDHWSSAWDPHFPRMAEDTVSDWAYCAEAVHAAGGTMLLQLSHPGAIRSESQALPSLPGPALSASGLYMRGKTNGRAATTEELDEIRRAFVHAARLAIQAGMDGIELHACHGFFLDEFLWAQTNVREDRYGGLSLAERATYPAEVIAAISEAIGPDQILSVRISQWKEVDYDAKIAETPEELAILLAAFEQAGANLLHVSARRFYEPAFTGSQLGLAGWCKQLSELPVIVVGSVGLSSDVMASLVGTPSKGLPLDHNLRELNARFARGEFDLVAVGRSLIADPDWPSKVRAGQFDTINSFEKSQLGIALEMEPQMIKDVHG